MIKKKLMCVYVLCIAYVLFFVHGCESSKNSETAKETNIYLAGVSGNDSNNYTPCYWKNGQRTDLNKIGNQWSGYGNEIRVSEGDIYIAGTTTMDYGNTIPCFWKNGQRTDLNVGYEGEGNSIFPLGSVVYVAGSNQNSRGNHIGPCYWKNGQRFDLSVIFQSEYGPSGSAYSVCVSGSDVYIAGYTENESGTAVPCYWKNGQRTDLDENGEGWSLFVSGNDIFVAGYTYKSIEGDTPCYWKNGQRTDLTKIEATRPGGAASIFVSGTDVYVAGYNVREVFANNVSQGVYYAPCYWKNGQRTDLSVNFPVANGRATSVFVSGSDVYIAGTTNRNKPCYWKNEQRTDLDGNGHAASIYIEVVNK